MLFNSYIFIFLFLPITLIGFYFIGKNWHPRVAISWLVVTSLFFYGWWNPAYLGLIIGSMLFNYAIGVILGNRNNFDHKWTLIFGITANLTLIIYYKYANFFVENVNSLLGFNYNLQTIILPLGISFFTFQQIAYLVDAYKGKTKDYNFLHYSLFVTFFPQLIAGPIVHHKEMLSQFSKNMIYKLHYKNISVGLVIFTLGLFKKVVIADKLSFSASHYFGLAEQGILLSFFEAWEAALAYTLQLYFDFSGYSDMAIGLARLFGIRLPLNFNSPYKSTSIIDFWQRWHITLSRFLRDYIYIPLGGNRKGKLRRHINLFITMLLGGLWHGAGWTFIAWGALHGIYLIINHAWNDLMLLLKRDLTHRTLLEIWLARLITFFAIVIGWVLFRAESFSGAISILVSMVCGNGISLPQSYRPIFIIFIALIIACFAPNTQQFMTKFTPTIEDMRQKQVIETSYFQFSFTYFWCFIFSAIFSLSIIYLSRAGEFLYFNF